jgi:undecaprenyl-diphosphatase
MATNSPGAERRTLPRGRISVLRNALYSTLRFIARHVRGFYAALVAFLSVGLVVGLGAIGIFALFATAVVQGITQPFDEAVLRWFGSVRNPALDRVMVEITSLGNGAVLVLLIAVTSVFLWLTRHRWSVYLLALAYFGGYAINSVLKQYFERPRPTVLEHLDPTSSASFPSGHAMNAMIMYGAVAYLVGRLEPTAALRRTTWALAALLILAIGMSRAYLGVHYPSDVIAGYLAGLAWLTFVAAAMTALRFFATRRPETRAEEQDLDVEVERAAGEHA